jgi:hypothetical protein
MTLPHFPHHLKVTQYRGLGTRFGEKRRRGWGISGRVPSPFYRPADTRVFSKLCRVRFRSGRNKARAEKYFQRSRLVTVRTLPPYLDKPEQDCGQRGNIEYL